MIKEKSDNVGKQNEGWQDGSPSKTSVTKPVTRELTSNSYPLHKQ